jgi:hypothetical protein
VNEGALANWGLLHQIKKTGAVFRAAASGYGGLEVACWPLVPKFVGSRPAEAVGFLGQKNSSARLPSEGK